MAHLLALRLEHSSRSPIRHRSALGQTEKDGHSRSTAGQPPTAEMLTDWPAQSVSVVNRHQLVDPKDRKTNLKQSLVAGDCDGKICPNAVVRYPKG